MASTRSNVFLRVGGVHGSQGFSLIRRTGADFSRQPADPLEAVSISQAPRGGQTLTLRNLEFLVNTLPVLRSRREFYHEGYVYTIALRISFCV